MKKQELILYMEEKRKEGWQTHSAMLGIYNDDEDIPEEMVDALCHPSREQHIIIMMGSGMREKLDEMLTKFLKDE